MDRKLNRAKIDAALRRAGEVAASGPRSSRAGRFLSTGPAKRLPGAMTVEHVSSTVVTDIAYDPDSKRLKVTFVSGKSYDYDGVPADVVDAFLSASSKGAYFNSNIRDAYEYREAS